LPEQTCGEASVEIHHLPLGDDVAGDLEGGGARAGLEAFAGELEAHFYHIDWLDAGCGRHAGEAAVYKGEGGAEVGVLQQGAGRGGGFREGG